MWLGIDDTDSPRSGCTTWVLTEVLRLARDAGLDPIGYPRLVRLNPNVPWKTRGNAALSVRVGRGRGAPRTIGRLDGRTLRAYPTGGELPGARAAAFEAEVWRRIGEVAPADAGTDPALVVAPRRPSPELYWNAVRELVPIDAAKRAVRAVGGRWRTRGDERGLVGAAAAIAWPGRRTTWELVAYREPARIGTPRRVSSASVRRAADRVPGLFLCHDPRTRRVLVAPHTNCPILFGLRSADRSPPTTALRWLRTEPVDRWVVFRTNQGTGDHLVARFASDVLPFRSAYVRGEVASVPAALRGGHVSFRLRDERGSEIPCVAFEPTKTLPKIAQQLRPGDGVTVWGSRGTGPALQLEGLRWTRAAPAARRWPPRCRACDRTAGSLGRGRGYRCPGCRRTFPPEAGVRRGPERLVQLGTHHPTASARRHLALRAPEV